MDALLLRAAIKRGVLLVSSNWPIVLIDFAVESLCKLALMLPIVGGALMVTTVAGLDVGSVLAGGLLSTADVVVGSLTNVPVALIAFLAAVALVAVGGEALQFIVKAGTLSVLVRADRQAGEVQRMPLGSGNLRRAHVFGLEILVDAGRRFARRGVALAVGLGAIYALVATSYLALITWDLPGVGAAWTPAWSAIVLVATSAAVVVVGGANVAYTLLRVVIITDDCDIRTAIGRLGRFVIEDARQVIGVFAVIAGIELLAAAVSLLAAAGLAPIAYLPLASLIVLPLQAAVWLLRGLIFEALSLVGVAAYQTQYRRFGASRWPARAISVPETDEAPLVAPPEQG